MLKMTAQSLFPTLIFLSLFAASYCVCPKDEFQCDTIKCINVSLRCDGQKNCDDNSDELNCNVTETMRNATNVTMPTYNTSPQTTTPNNLTISPPFPLNNNNNKPCSVKKCKEDKAMKNKKKLIQFNNYTKRRKERPFHRKTSASSRKEASTLATMATDKITSGEVTTNTNVEGVSVTQCSFEECTKWTSCWSDVRKSHECICTEAACIQGLKGSAHAGKESKRKMKDVFEWVIISILSTGLIVAIIVLLVKQRRLRRNKVNIHTVVCYHHGQPENAWRQGQGAAESRPLCDKARNQSRGLAQDEENVCYIDFIGQVTRNK